MHEYKVNVLRVVDGDTVDVDIDLGFSTWLKKQRIRLYGIDTPETRTRDLDEKKYGKMATNFLSDTIKDAEVVALRTYKDKKGKYGRILGEIICDGVNMNQVMVETHLAVAYFGQSKKMLQNNTCKTENLLTIRLYSDIMNDKKN